MRENSKLKSIAGGPLPIDEEGNLNLEDINTFLKEKGLKLDIKYFKNEDRYGFSLYEVRKDNLNLKKGAFYGVMEKGC